MQEPGQTGGMDRGARVRLIKRVIIGLLVFILVLPTVLCIILFCKFERLERQLKEISSAEEVIMETENTKLKDVKANNSEEPYIAVVSGEGTSEAKPHNDETSEISQGESFENGAAESKVSENNILDGATLPEQKNWPKKVYLTFDDGPSSNTDDILDILDRYNIKGNFFVVAKEQEDLRAMYRRIVEEGHVIGMHSYSHKYSEIYASKEAFINDLSKIQSLVYEETGFMPDIYRFPGGSSNEVSKLNMSVFIQVLNDRDITYYDWNVSSEDTSGTIPTKEQIVDNCLTNIQNYEEVMLLMHDLGNKTTTVEALPEIIERLLDMGIEIAPIDKNTMHIQHTNIQ